MNFIEEVNNKKDIQKLLNIYINIIKDHNKNIIFSYRGILEKLKEEFGLIVTLEDIQLYYESTIEEEIEDTKNLMKNLNIRYE